MRFIVTLKNWTTGKVVEREVTCAHDATSIIACEAKRQMNIPSTWDCTNIVRVHDMDAALGEGRR
jgi:hypothetical protein